MPLVLQAFSPLLNECVGFLVFLLVWGLPVSLPSSFTLILILYFFSLGCADIRYYHDVTHAVAARDVQQPAAFCAVVCAAGASCCRCATRCERRGWLAKLSLIKSPRLYLCLSDSPVSRPFVLSLSAATAQWGGGGCSAGDYLDRWCRGNTPPPREKENTDREGTRERTAAFRLCDVPQHQIRFFNPSFHAPRLNRAGTPGARGLWLCPQGDSAALPRHSPHRIFKAAASWEPRLWRTGGFLGTAHS